MRTLLVSGCSMTHGAGLHNNFMHPENIKGSYSQYLADRLNCNLHNVALSAASNEYIFHSIMDNIDSLDIHSVVVMWTTTGRLYWRNQKRHYFFSGGFGSSLVDLINFKMHDQIIDGNYFTGDNEEIVNKISKVHKFFITDYFNHDEEKNKLTHYVNALSSVCKFRNIKLISIDWNYISNIGNWAVEKRHPNSDEHKKIAERIYREYYENQQ